MCFDATDALAKEALMLSKLSNLLNDLVTEWVGNVECGHIQVSKDYHWAIYEKKVLGMPIPLAKESLKQKLLKKNKNWNQDIFEDIWSKMLQGFLNPNADEKPLLEMILDSHYHRHRLFKSYSASKKTLTCRMKQGLLQAAKRYSMELSFIGIILALFTLFYTKRQQSIKESMVIVRLVEDIVDAVQQETQAHQQDSLRHPLPGIKLL
jgi:hypothetical protein